MLSADGCAPCTTVGVQLSVETDTDACTSCFLFFLTYFQPHNNHGIFEASGTASITFDFLYDATQCTIIYDQC
jgi:hypothetical protein